MNQLALDLTPPRARKRDPQTSHDAAEKAKTFQARHIALIWDVLREFKKYEPWPERYGKTPRQLAEILGMDYIAIQRRGAEMERKGLITRGPDKRDGQLVWRAK